GPRPQHPADGRHFRFRVPLPAGPERDRDVRGGAPIRRGQAAAGDAQDRSAYRLHMAGAVGVPWPCHAGGQRNRRVGEGANRRQFDHQGRLRHRGRAVPRDGYTRHYLRSRQHRSGAQAERVGDAGTALALRELHAAADGPRLHRISIMPNTVIFDLGNVLVRWNPRLLYEQLITDGNELEQFFETVVTHDWIRAQDAGRTFEEG